MPLRTYGSLPDSGYRDGQTRRWGACGTGQGAVPELRGPGRGVVGADAASPRWVTSFDATDAAPLRVRVTSSHIATDPGTTSPGPDAGASPRIHHTADATAVVGVGRTAAALHKT